jgi:hypothetical protein
MDSKFRPASDAVNADDLETFKALVAADPSLATARSMRSHPTLLQCVALDGKDKTNTVAMATLLIDAGAELNEPLVAAASIDNRPLLSYCSIVVQRLTVLVVGRRWRKLCIGTAGT